ncbi:MAG TPA: SCO family protein [Myxococcota bacterium]
MRARWPLALAFLLATACGAREWEGRGVVREVHLEDAQVVIEHEAIPGLMEAMTMSFDVPDRALLERMQKGAPIEFTLRREGHAFQVVDFAPARAGVSGSGPALPELAEVRDVAPDFDLIDQRGEPLRSADLRGKVVLLDFIFTHCPGPCPILTSSHVTLQRLLPGDARDRTHFVSITIDPARDTPEVLREYAEARGADLSRWSFLTGPAGRIDAVIRAYGVGKVIEEDGEIVHTVATFLIDPEGRIAKRYLGLEHEPKALLDDLLPLL